MIAPVFPSSHALDWGTRSSGYRWNIGALSIVLALLRGFRVVHTEPSANDKSLSARNASASHCYPDGCDDIGVQRRDDATFRGNLATLLGVSGTVLVGGGAALFYLGRPSSEPNRQAALSARSMLGAAPGIVTTGIEGVF